MPQNGTVTAAEIVFGTSEAIVAIVAVLGNLLIILAFVADRNLRTITNAYVFSLAITDLLVGSVGIPFTLYTMLTGRPTNLLACLLFNTWIMTLCTISILHLLAVSYDRLFVIIRLTTDSPRKKRRRAVTLISLAWLFGALIGFLPLMGWNKGRGKNQACIFLRVMDLSYLVFLYFATIIAPTILMAFFYLGIYWKVREHHNRSGLSQRQNSGHIQRLETRRKKIILSLFIVIVSFLVGWYPLYTLNTIAWFRPGLYLPFPLFLVSIGTISYMTSSIFSSEANYRRSLKSRKMLLTPDQGSMWNSGMHVKPRGKNDSAADMLQVTSNPTLLNQCYSMSVDSSPVCDNGAEALLEQTEKTRNGNSEIRFAMESEDVVDFHSDSQEEIML